MGAMAGGGISLGSLWVEINARVDDAVREIQKFGRDVGKTLEEQEKKFESFAKVGDKLKGVGTSMTAALTLPLAGLGAASVKAASTFEASMNKIEALADLSAAQLKELEQAALKWGADTQFSAQQVAEAMTELAAKGFDTTKILATMPGILSLAAAGQLSLADASKIASNTLAQFGLNTSESGRVADVLAQAANKSAASVGDLGQAMNYVGPVAKSAGISFEQTAAMLAILSNGGREATQAGTDLRGIIASLVQPTDDAAKKLELLKVQTVDAAGKIKPLDQIFQELKKSGASTADMFQIFGREGATAASILVDKSGPALQAMTKDMLNAEGAAKKAADTLNKGFAFQMEQLKGSLETAGIAIGKVLIPPIQELLKHLTDLLNNVVLPLIAKFQELPEPVKALALGFTALVAAAGPALYMFGQFAGALTNIATLAGIAKKALAAEGLAGALGSIASLGPALVPVLVAIGAAIAAWAIYKAVTEIQQLNTELDRLYKLQAQGVRATKEQAQEIGVLEAALRRQGIEVKSTGMSTEQYIAAMKEALKNSGQFGEQAKIAGDMAAHLKTQLFGVKEGAKAGGDGMGGAADEAKKLSEAVKKQEENYKKVLRAYQDGKASLEQVTAAQIALQQAQDRADPQRVANRFAQAQMEMITRHDEMVKSVTEGRARIKQMDEELAASVERLGVAFGKAHYEMGEAAKKAVEVVKPLEERLPPAVNEAIKKNKELQESYKRLGVDSAESLGKQADQAAADYERIRASGTASARVIQEAWVKAEEARIAAAEAAGIEIPEAQRKALKQMKDALGQHAKETVSVYDTLKKQVSTILTDFGKDVTELLFGLFKKNPENERLKKEEADLQKSLEKRAAEVEKYEQEYSRQMEKAHAEYAESLAKEEAELQKSLDERAAEYEAYQAEVAGKLDDLRASHAAEAAEEIADLTEALDEKEEAYEEYKQEVVDKIRELREENAEDLEEDLARLRDQLQEKTQAYEDFAEDAVRSLDRIRAAAADDADDEQRETGRRISDKQREYARDVEDYEDKIRREESKGEKANKEQIADWRRTLQRKQQDLQLYIQRANEDLAEWNDDHKRKVTEQEEDVKESLDRRTRDHNDYLAENKAAQAKTVTDHAEDLAKQEADLTGSLEKRGQELGKFRDETNLKIEEVTAKHAAEYAKEEKDLTDSLGRKKTEYDNYKTEVGQKFEDVRAAADAKLKEQEENLKTSHQNMLAEWDQYKADAQLKFDEIKNAYTTTWDNVKGVIGGIFESGAQAASRFATETIAGELTKALNDLLDGPLKSVSKAIGGLFGGGGKATEDMVDFGDMADAIGGKPKPSVPSTGAGGAAGAAGGFAGMASMITGFAQLGLGVFQSFQFSAMNKTLDLIENYTRYLKIGLVTQADSLLNDSHIIRNEATDANKNYWGTTVTYFQDWSAKLENLVTASQSCSGFLDTIKTNMVTETNDAMRHTEAQTVRGEIRDALGRTLNVTLQGTDAELVASHLGAYLRSQGVTV